MNKLSLRVKLGVGFGALLLVLTITSTVAYVATFRMADATSKIVVNSEKRDLINQMVVGIEKQTTGIRGYLLAGREDLLKHDQEGQQEYKEGLAKLESLLVTEKGKKLFADIAREYVEYRSIAEQEIQFRRAGNSKAALNLAFAPHTAEVRTNLRNQAAELEGLIDSLAEAAVKESEAIESGVRTIVLAGSIIGFIVGILVAVLMIRSITRAITKMVTMIQEIAANNLAIEDMEITSHDEIGKAGTALNTMKNSLHEVVQSIAETSQHVASASEELSATSQQITANSEETSAQANVVATAAQQVSQNLQTVATGAEEMGATIKEIAKNATEAARVATSAVKVAEDTNATVAKLGGLQHRDRTSD